MEDNYTYTLYWTISSSTEFGAFLHIQQISKLLQYHWNSSQLFNVCSWSVALFQNPISPPDFLLVFPPFWTANGVGAAAYPPPYEVTTVIRINFFLSYSSTSYLIFISCYLILCRQSYTLYLILTDVCMISHTIIISFHIVRCTTCHITNGSCLE